MSLFSRLFGKTESSTEILCPHCERSMGAGHDVDACARKRMSRRYFFGVLGGAAAVLAGAHADLSLDLDALTDRYIQPAVAALVDRINGNTILTPEIVARETLKMFKRNLSAAMDVQRDYNRHFNNVGDVLSVRAPRGFRIS